MKIGIDAKWLFSGNPSGKVVVNNILKYLIENNEQHQLYIFLKKGEENLSFPFLQRNVKLIYVWGNNNQLSNLFVLPKHIRRLKLDVFLSFYFSPLFISCKKVVFVFDAIFKSNPEYFTRKELFYFSTIKPLAQKSDLILTISESEKKRLIQYGIGTQKNVDVIYMGVDPKFKPIEKHNADDVIRVKIKYKLPENFLLYVGRLNVRKNIPNLLKAISILRNESLKTVLVGKFDWKNFNLPEILKELHIEDKVILPGFVDDEDLPIFYSLAKLFCFVSYDEGFGLPPLESMASGVPVVVANSGSLPEVCGDAGVYCSPNDPEDIAKKINSLLTNSNLYNEKKQKGLEISQNFNWKLSSQKLLNLFEQLNKN